jgi:hypothetical protein
VPTVPITPPATTSTPATPAVPAVAAVPALPAATPATPATLATPATPPTSTSAAASAPTGRWTARAPVRSTDKRRPFRPVVKRFRLAHATRIRVTVRQVYPVCKTLPSFFFAGRKGRNALRLPKRIVTKVGTYQLVAHAQGHKLFSVRARVLRGRHLLIDKGTANACAAARIEAAALILTPVTSQEHHGVASAHERRSALPQGISHSPRDTNPLVRAITLLEAPASIRPLLFILLAMSICLLGMAAMPQTMLPAGPLAGVVAQRRIYFATAGIWLLAVVIVVRLLS